MKIIKSLKNQLWTQILQQVQALFLFPLLFLFLIILVILSLSVGGSSIGFQQLVKWFVAPESLGESVTYILSQLRFPRTMAAIFVGANLGLTGALLQTLLRNPLAEPYTLGLSGGATLGAVIAILLRLQPAWLLIPFSAVVGCSIVTAIILKISWRETFYSQRTLILCGVMISLFCGSIVVLLMTLFDPYQIQSSFFWMLGQIGSERDHWWPLLAFATVAGLILSLKNSKHLDRLLLGDDVATSLGTNVSQLRLVIVIAVALLCSISVSVAGLIGFVGLLSPHLAILIFRRQHRWYLPASTVMGATFLLSADIVGRVIAGEKEIPAGGLVALIGAPVLIYLMLKWERHART